MIDLTKEGSLKESLTRLQERFEVLRETAPTLSAEQLQREQEQNEHNLYAEQCPNFAAARSAAVHHLVLPLVPGDIKPMVLAKDATNDPRRLMDWWAMWPTANVGVVVGRAGNLVAMEVRDHDSLYPLMKPTIEYSEQSGKECFNYPYLGAGRVRLQRQGPVSRTTMFVGWEKTDKSAGKMKDAWVESLTSDEHCWLVWSYPLAPALDAWDYRRKRIGSGLVVLGEEEIVPWAGVVGDARIEAPGNPLVPVPSYLTSKLGNARSRKIMAAVAAQRAADERMMNARYYATLAEQRDLENEERARAAKDRVSADAAFAKAMKEAAKEPVAEWIEPEPDLEKEQKDEKTYFYNPDKDEDDE
jgi:hypothetical protein